MTVSAILLAASIGAAISFIGAYIVKRLAQLQQTVAFIGWTRWLQLDFAQQFMYIYTQYIFIVKDAQ